MKFVASIALFLLLIGGFVSPFYAYANNSSDEGLLCSVLGWFVRPLGFCEHVETVTVVTVDKEILKTLVETKPLVLSDTESSIASSSNNILNDEQILIESNAVTEELLNQRIVEVLQYINSLPFGRVGDKITSNSQTLSNRDYVLKTVDRVYDRLGDNNDEIIDGGNLNDTTLFNAVLTGATSVESMYFNDNVPASVLGRLYSTAGDLYWNGSILSASTSGDWTGGSGNVFRLSGNVGIGTNTPTETLTVAGTLSAGTTTARIYDTGGQVCNVEAYGAVGDNSTDNYAAIMAAISACPEGGIVYFPMGQYRISQTIVLDKPVTLRGSYAPRWTYSSSPRSSIRAAFGTFVGDSIIHVRDRTISGEVNHNNGGRLENITIDGGSYGADVTGLYFEGLVRDWKLTDVDITQTSGNGFEAAVGTGEGNPRGFTIRGLAIYSASGHGFRATALNDSYIEDLLAVGNALRGIYISSMGETKINNSRAVFNALEGLYIDGSSSNGGLMFTDFSTDRNDRHGVRISLTGTTSVTFNGLLTRRDGANNGGGTETPYAGVAIIGSVSEKVAPVFINGLSQIIGVDDSGNPPLAPLVGVRVTNASYAKIEGQLWGVDDAYADGGGNQFFVIEEDSIIKVGSDGVTENAPPIHNNKWVAATNTASLYYDGRVSIGSTTGSRLLNITAPAQAGARFIDSTNSVTFDMRAEDFQAFFGTFSNHQLRFQTNNTSRLTIDTDGDIGIGTTAPDQALDVVGTIQSSALLGGAVNLTTDANGNIIRDPSDVRLKTNILDIDNALNKVLQLRGVSYEWKDKERFGEQVEIGFIAQEVDEVVPEVVRKGGDYWALNTRNLLAIVVEAIKDIWETVLGNQTRITELEMRVTELENMLEVSVVDSDAKYTVDNNVTENNVTAESLNENVTTTTTTTNTNTVPSSEQIPEVATSTETVTIPETTLIDGSQNVFPNLNNENSTDSATTSTDY